MRKQPGKKKPRPTGKKLPTAWHFLKPGIGHIRSGAEARHAISETLRFGATGRELRFALRTIRHRLLLTGRIRYENAHTFEQIEALKRKDDASGLTDRTKRVLASIEKARAEARASKELPTGKKPPKPSIDVAALRPQLTNLIRGVTEFGRDTNIVTRATVFRNLRDGTQKSECKQVAEWLDKMGDHYMYQTRRARSYREHADLGDFASRCYGSASALYQKVGFKNKENDFGREQIEIQKKLYAAHARRGLSNLARH